MRTIFRGLRVRKLEIMFRPTPVLSAPRELEGVWDTHEAGALPGSEAPRLGGRRPRHQLRVALSEGFPVVADEGGTDLVIPG